jgi:hypothetical protein
MEDTMAMVVSLAHGLVGNTEDGILAYLYWVAYIQ